MANCVGEGVRLGVTLRWVADFSFRGPAIEAVARKGGIAVGAGNIAEHFVVGAVFADDEEAVLEMGKRRLGRRWSAVLAAMTVWVRTSRSGQDAEQDRAQAAEFERADIGGGVGIVLAAAVGAGAFALGVDHVERGAVGREGDGRRIPAHGDMGDDLHGGGVDDGDGVDARIRRRRGARRARRGHWA